MGKHSESRFKPLSEAALRPEIAFDLFVSVFFPQIDFHDVNIKLNVMISFLSDRRLVVLQPPLKKKY